MSPEEHILLKERKNVMLENGIIMLMRDWSFKYNMIVKGIIDEDFVNYKKCSMTIMFPYCSFKCEKECGKQVCQNSKLAKSPEIEVFISDIIKRYKNNIYSESIVCQGLEPFDSWPDLYSLVISIRCEGIEDDIVIYTGYREDEISDKIDRLKKYKNIIVKFGRYIPDREKHYDEVLGVELASDNQYAEKIS